MRVRSTRELTGRHSKVEELDAAPLHHRVFGPETSRSVLGLQQTIGNRATCQRLVKNDSESVPDIRLNEDDLFEKDGGMAKGDLSGQGTVASAPAADDIEDLGPVPLQIGNVDVVAKNPQQPVSEVGAKAADAVQAGSVGTTWSQPGGKVVDPFGSESFNPAFSGIKVNVPKKKGWFARTFNNAKPDPVTVDFTIDVTCGWGVNGGGKVDVSSGTDSVVTNANYTKIVEDLTPQLKEKSWRAPRSTYWSEAICARHEKFHSTDDKAWAEGPGKAVVTDYVKTQSVGAKTATADLGGILEKAGKLMSRENTAFYTGGAGSYLSYAGEERAFGDGKQPYLDLAAAVKKQGESLAPPTPTETPETK